VKPVDLKRLLGFFILFSVLDELASALLGWPRDGSRVSLTFAMFITVMMAIRDETR
jgi:hypothetical protein